ncbi:polysaccharide biosynthesis protein, partial [gut metagenome]
MGYSTIYGMINSVGQPVFREAYTDKERLQHIFRKMLRFTALVTFPAMLGLGIVSKELITITITEKWLPCVPII